MNPGHFFFNFSLPIYTWYFIAAKNENWVRDTSRPNLPIRELLRCADVLLWVWMGAKCTNIQVCPAQAGCLRTRGDARLMAAHGLELSCSGRSVEGGRLWWKLCTWFGFIGNGGRGRNGECDTDDVRTGFDTIISVCDKNHSTYNSFELEKGQIHSGITLTVFAMSESPK